MTQEIATSETKGPVLPDGIGLTLEQAKALIANKNNIALADDEPALMGITICNAYLGELQKLHERHSQGLAKLMAEKTNDYVSSVHASIEQLTANMSSASVEGMRKVLEDQAARLDTFKSTIFWATAIVSVSALLSVAVFVLRGLR
jgi:hypothetical protein